MSTRRISAGRQQAKDMNDMKAWLVEEPDEGYATIVFAKRRNKARYLAIQYDESLQDYRYDEVRATRMPQLDECAGDSPYVMDFNIDEDRLIMVRDAGFSCFEPEYDDCEKCVAKDYCDKYEDYLETRRKKYEK